MKYDILGLLPPTNVDAGLDRWQRAITATVLIVIALLISSNAVLGAALLHAQQEQVTISQKIDSMADTQKADGLFTRIMTMRSRYCEAEQRGWDVQRVSWGEQVTTAIGEYQALSHLPFPELNPC